MMPMLAGCKPAARRRLACARATCSHMYHLCFPASVQVHSNRKYSARSYDRGCSGSLQLDVAQGLDTHILVNPCSEVHDAGATFASPSFFLLSLSSSAVSSIPHPAVSISTTGPSASSSPSTPCTHICPHVVVLELRPCCAYTSASHHHTHGYALEERLDPAREGSQSPLHPSTTVEFVASVHQLPSTLIGQIALVLSQPSGISAVLRLRT